MIHLTKGNAFTITVHVTLKYADKNINNTINGYYKETIN